MNFKRESLRNVVAFLHRGMEQLEARYAHNVEVEGSSPSSATKGFVNLLRKQKSNYGN